MAGGSVPANQIPLFEQAAAATHVPANVLAGIASVETNLGANKNTSSAGAQGELQFMPSTAKQFGLNPYNLPAAILDAGKLLNQYGYQSNPTRAIGAYNGGPGNPQYGYAKQVLSEAARLAGVFGKGGVKVPGAARGASFPGSSITTSKSVTVPAAIDWNAAEIAGLEKANSAPIRMDGSFKPVNTLGDILAAGESGQFMTPAHTTVTNDTTRTLGSNGTAPGPSGHPAGGNVSPLPGFTIGRTDMGVDASSHAGQPIKAPNDLVIVHIYPNWYAGQPYVLARLTAGPDAGRYIYVSEQITNLPHVGQHIPKGGTWATYAPTGTGIEIGWGTPGWQTQAQASGNTGDASHGNSPAGVDFKKHFGL